MMEPGPDDILNAVNTAISDLTDAMNQKMEEMKGYVDTQVINSMHEIISNEYQ